MFAAVYYFKHWWLHSNKYVILYYLKLLTRFLEILNFSRIFQCWGCFSLVAIVLTSVECEQWARANGLILGHGSACQTRCCIPDCSSPRPAETSRHLCSTVGLGRVTDQDQNLRSRFNFAVGGTQVACIIFCTQRLLAIRWVWKLLFIARSYLTT